MMSVEGDWAAICFELKVNDKTMMALLPVFQKAWDDRKELMGQMQSGEVDRMVLMEQMTAIQTELEKGYEEILTKVQKEHLAKVRASRQGGGQGGGQRGGGR